MQSKAKNKILEVIDSLQEEILDFLRSLVEIPSVVGSEGRAQEFIKDKFERMKLDTNLIKADKTILQSHPGYCEVPWDYEDRPNVIGILRGKTRQRSLILNGHIDVVSPEPVHLWKHDPWGAEIEEGKLYGRGALDMKAGIAAMTYAVQSIQKAGIELDGDVILESVIEEEAGGSGGTLATLLNGVRGDGAIIPEPTSLNLIVASSGVNYFRVGIDGKTGHPQHARSSVDAIEKTLLVLNSLRELNRRRREEVNYPLFEGEADYACDLNVGVFKAGDWPSTIPGWAEMDCRVSFTPNEKMEEIKGLVEKTIFQKSQSDSWLKNHPPKVTWFGLNVYPSEQSTDHPLVQIVKRIAEEECGIDPKYRGIAAAIDSRLFIRYGDIPSFCFGPRGNGLHGIDEFVIIEDVFKVTKILACTILEWLNH